MGVYVCYVLVPAPMHIESVRVVSQTQMAAAQNISLGRLTPLLTVTIPIEYGRLQCLMRRLRLTYEEERVFVLQCFSRDNVKWAGVKAVERIQIVVTMTYHSTNVSHFH